MYCVWKLGWLQDFCGKSWESLMEDYRTGLYQKASPGRFRWIKYMYINLSCTQRNNKLFLMPVQCCVDVICFTDDGWAFSKMSGLVFKHFSSDTLQICLQCVCALCLGCVLFPPKTSKTLLEYGLWFVEMHVWDINQSTYLIWIDSWFFEEGWECWWLRRLFRRSIALLLNMVHVTGI